MQLQSHPQGQLPRQPGSWLPCEPPGPALSPTGHGARRQPRTQPRWPLRRRVGARRGAGGPGPTLTRSENYGRALLPAGRCRSWERCLPRERDERFPALPTGRGTGWAPRELRGQQPLLRHVAMEPVAVTWHRVRLPGRSLAPERAPGPARTPHPPALPQCPCREGRGGQAGWNSTGGRAPQTQEGRWPGAAGRAPRRRVAPGGGRDRRLQLPRRRTRNRGAIFSRGGLPGAGNVTNGGWRGDPRPRCSPAPARAQARCGTARPSRVCRWFGRSKP